MNIYSKTFNSQFSKNKSKENSICHSRINGYLIPASKRIDTTETKLKVFYF